MKLLRGDCLELMKDIPDKSIDMILCDLPYGTTAASWDSIIPFDNLWEQYDRIIKKDKAVVLFGLEPFSSYLRLSNIKNYKYDWIWNKKLAGNGINAKRHPLKIHELIHIFNSNIYYPIMTKGKMRRKMTGSIQESELTHGNSIASEKINDDYYPKSILEFGIGNLRINRLHPTQKPIDLLEYIIKTYTLENETVLDNTMGSGSTGVACVNTNRNFIGMELDQKYFEIAQKRIEEAQKEKDLQIFS